MIRIFRVYLALLFFILCANIMCECYLPIQYFVWGFITWAGTTIIWGNND